MWLRQWAASAAGCTLSQHSRRTHAGKDQCCTYVQACGYDCMSLGCAHFAVKSCVPYSLLSCLLCTQGHACNFQQSCTTPKTQYGGNGSTLCVVCCCLLLCAAVLLLCCSAMVASWVSQASFEPLGLTIAVAKDRAIESMMQVRQHVQPTELHCAVNRLMLSDCARHAC